MSAGRIGNPRASRPVITLLTDFGTADPFVGVMKGVIARICPDANVIDITHEVAPQDVRSAAFFLERSFRYFPEGTVHVAVVDPGVGTARPAVALSSGGHLFVGPDNGILSLAAPRGRGVKLTRRSYFLSHVSNTFHGRDVFAPVAAHLASGVPLEKLGPVKRRFVKLASPRPRKTKRGLVGRIVSVDRFGNLITNFEPDDWRALRRPSLVAGDFVSGELRSSYAAAPPGELLIVFGGYGLLEIAVRNGSAAETLEMGAGDKVRLASVLAKYHGAADRETLSRRAREAREQLRKGLYSGPAVSGHVDSLLYGKRPPSARRPRRAS